MKPGRPGGRRSRVRMRRVAVVAPAEALRDVLVRVADGAAVEIGPASGQGPPGPAKRRRARQHAGCAGRPSVAPPFPRRGPTWTSSSGPGAMTCWPARPSLRPTPPAGCGGRGRRGWRAGCPATRLAAVAAALAEAGGAVVPLPQPAGREPPTLLAGPAAAARAVAPGADVRHGAVRRHRPGLAGLGELRADVRHDVRRRRRGPAAGRGRGGAAGRLAAVGAPVPPGLAVRRRAPGLAATVFGLLYGECFGPTGVVPALWLNPLDQPVTLLWPRPGSARSCSPARTRSARSTGGGRAAGRPRCTRRRASRAARCSSGPACGGAAGISIGSLLAAGGLVAIAGLGLAAAGFLAEAGGGRRRDAGVG